MKTRLQQRTIVFVVTCGMLVILPALAYLQYTWLGQLSEQESRQMRDNVRTSAFHCAMDFGEEMAGFLKSIGGPISGSDENIRRELASRVRKWQSTSTHPHFVSDDIVIAALPFPDSSIMILVDQHSMILMTKSLTSAAVPIQSRKGSAAFVPLDRTYIISSVIPKIITSHFSDIMRADYNIAILDMDGHPLWENRVGAASGIRDSADAVIPLVAMPPAPLAFMRESRPDWNDRQPNPERPPEPPRDEPGRNVQRNPEMFSPSSPQNMDRLQSIITLCVRHREGSLEAAVNSNRIRNLVIGFGILVLLGTTVIFLLISATRAQRLAQQQLEFVAGISHELRTPLAVMKSVGENLADGIVREEQRTKQYGDLIKNEVVRLSAMVEHALAYAGIQSGNKTYEKHPLHIAVIVKDTVRKYAKLPEDERPIMELSLAENLPPVQGDAHALQSALDNLLTNALKYSTEDNWIGIDVRSVVRKGRTWIEIAVRDRGIGIPADDVGDIFKPFYRAGNAVDKQTRGSGLGLNITQHILEAHGGHITVESVLHKGSTFTMWIPASIDKG